MNPLIFLRRLLVIPAAVVEIIPFMFGYNLGIVDLCLDRKKGDQNGKLLQTRAEVLAENDRKMAWLEGHLPPRKE